jgi:putative transcription factor
MNHQDWKPVVLRKAPEHKSKGPSRPRYVESTGVNKKKLDEDEDYRPPTVTSAMGRQIQQARMAKKLTQKQLAQQCNLQAALIQQYEQGKGVYNRPNLNKIGRVLGIHIKKSS